MVAAASSRHALGWCAVFAAVPALIGCDFETAGLEELLDADPSYLNVPGKRLAEGRFSKLEIQGSHGGGAAVLALKDEQELSIVPFAGGGGCSVGRVGSFGQSLSWSSSKKHHVPFVEDPNESGFGILRFTDFDCALSAVNLPDSELPLQQLLKFGAEPREFAVTGSAELHVLDPWNEAQSKIAGAVTSAKLATGALWTIENGELVLRDSTLVELRRLGTAVSELLVDEFGGQQAAYIDAEGVHLITALEDPPILLDRDACELGSWLFGRYVTWLWLSYLSPCSSRRLVSVELKSLERFEFGENASSHALLYPLGGTVPEGHAFFVTESVTVEPTGPAAKLWAVDDRVHVGTLWGGRMRAPPARGPERAVLESTSFPFQDKVRVVVDFDGVKGRLVEWNLADGSITELAQGVVSTNGSEVLANFDGTVGDLVRVELDWSVELLAERVPAPSTYGLKFRRAVLSDFDGTTGTLLLFDGALDQNAEVIARGVPLDGFNFMWESAILYQDEFDPVSSTGRLVARFISTADTFRVQTGVGEFHETSWPEQGVLYSVTEGSNSGIWFARAR